MAGFTGGEKLTAYLQGMAAKLAGSPEVEVGFFSQSTEADGTPVPLVAAMNEFGNPSKGQPPRPFFRSMITKESGHWGADTAALLKANDMNVPLVLDLMGEEISGELRESIVALVDPPLAESTIRRKGFAKPLVETGTMLNSIGHRSVTT